MKNLFKPNSIKVSKILMSLKISVASLAVSSYAMNHEKLGFWLLATVGVIDVILSGFSTNEQG